MENSDDARPKQKTDLPESTLRIMKRMLNTPPKPHDKTAKQTAKEVHQKSGKASSKRRSG